MFRLLLILLASFISFFCFSQHPSNLQTNNITSSSVDLSWDQSICASNVYYKYRIMGGSWIVFGAPGVSSPPISLSSLSASSDYEWSVKCAGTPGWSNPVSFTTSASCNLINSLSITNATCDNTLNGSATISTNNGIPPYQYQWSNNSTNSSINSVISDTYIVTTTDSIGCSVVDTIFIGSDNNINLSQSISPFVDTNNTNFPNTVQNYNIWVWDTLRLTNFGCNVNVRPEFNIFHENSPIQQGQIEIRWLSPFGYVPILYNIDNIGQAFGFWSTASNDSTGITSTSFSTNEILIKVRFKNQAPYGRYTAVWNTKEVDSQGNIIQTITQNDTAILNFVNCNNFSINNDSIFDINCSGDSSGFISINSITNGSGDYSYIWTNNLSPLDTISINSTAQNLNSGNYTCQIFDNLFGCNTSKNFLITDPLPILVNENISNISCYGRNDGSVEIDILGGTSPYSYAWGGYNPDSLQSGSYTYSIIDASGCSYTDSITISEPDIMLSGLSYNDITNCIFDDGAINLNPSGGPSNYFFNWSNGSTSQNLQNLSPGLYSVIISSDTNNDQLTCSVSDSVEIKEYITNISTSITSPSLNGYNISCFGGNDGTILSNTNNNIGPITYSWSNGASTQNINSAQAGYYQLIASDSLGCSDTSDITLIQSTDTFEVIYSTNNISCAGINDGSANFEIVGGITGSFLGDTNYLIIFNGNSNIILNPDSTFTSNNLNAGTYPFSISDLAGCTINDTLNILGANALNLSLISDTICCNGGTNGSINAQLTGGIGPFTYNWSGPNGTIQVNSSAVNGISAGNYSLTVLDGNNCVIQNSISVYEKPNLSITIDNLSNVSCLAGNDGSVSLNVDGGSGNYNYFWTNSTGVNISNNSTLNNLFADSYTCVVSSIGCQGCPDSITVNITQPSTALLSTYSQNNITCNGLNNGDVTINFSGGNQALTNGDTSYTLFFNGNINTIIYPTNSYVKSNLSPGNYTYSITDNNGCTIFDVVNIIEPNPLEISFSFDTICCNGLNTGNIQSNIIGGTPNYFYNWSGPNGFISNDSSLSLVPAGSYFLSLTDQNGCSDTNSMILIENPDLNITIDSLNNIKCKGENTGYISVLSSGGDGNYSFTWYNGSLLMQGQNSPSIDNLFSGDYLCIVSDNCGCTDSIFATISEPVNTLSSSFIKNDVSCFGQNDGSALVYFYGGTTGANSGDINYVLGWEGNTYTLLNPIDSFITPVGVPPGVYPYSATDINGCIIYDTITILEPDSLNLSYSTGNGAFTNGFDIDCFGNATQLNISAVGGIAPYSFSLNNSPYSTNINSFTFNPVFSGNQSISIVDNNGCIFDTIISISEPSQITDSLEIGNASCHSICDGQIISSAQGGIQPYYYVWNNLQNSIIDTSLIPLKSNLCSGNYTLTVIDQNNCINNVSTTISEPNPISIILDSIIDIVTYGNNDGAIYISALGGTGALDISWSFNNVFFSNSQNIDSLSPGSYQLEVIDSNSCVYNELFIITQPTSLSITIDSIQNTLCYDSYSGSINITANGGDSTYSFTWTGPNGFTSVNDDISSLYAGEYIIIIDDSISTITDTFNIYEPQPITTNLSYDSILCHNGQTQAQLNTWGGTQPYSYLWSNGDNNYYSLLDYGTNSYMITDNNGCTFIDTFSISNPDSIIAQASTINPTCNNINDGQININIISGGEQPFNYYLVTNSMSQTNNLFLGLAEGSYNFSVTDNNGCIALVSAVLINPPPINSVVSSTDASCFGVCDGTGDVVASGGTQPYTYLWDNGNNNLCSGIHNVIITDNNGCLATNSILINEPNPLLINVWNYNNLLFASGGFSSYQWYNNNNIILGANDSILVATNSGNYHVMVSDSNGCFAESYTITYLINSALDDNITTKIYPNPTNNYVIISSNHKINSVILCNSVGNELFSVNNKQNIDEEIKIDLSKFARGVYFLKIKINNQIINERIILQ